ncbi:MAG: alkaline phosphatase [Halalkalicoccus sp.]
MKRRSFIAALGASGALAALGSGATVAASGDGDVLDRGVKNVIVLVGDGMGFDPIEATRFVHGDLTMQSMTSVGKVRTEPREGQVTDSGAAGTALATGLRAHDGQISVFGPLEGEMDEVTPLVTQLHAAAAVGKKTGLVTTTTMTHATPGSWGANVPDRGMQEVIADHYLEYEIDVLLGAGVDIWSDDQLDRAEELGYELLYDAADLEAAGDGKLLGLFDEGQMTYTLDRDDSFPWLDETTAAALDRLENDEGFFLMVEGGRIDHANHQCDPWTSIAETKEFDDAVEVALEYAEGRDDTLVVVTSDHECGGFTCGNDYGNVLDLESLDGGTEGSLESLAIRLQEEDDPDIEAAIEEYVDFDGDLDDGALEEIREAYDDGEADWGLDSVIGRAVSPHVGIGWGGKIPDDLITSHSGPSQLAVAYGPGVEEATGSWFHLADLSATVSAIMLFGGIVELGETDRERWERRVCDEGTRGVDDAVVALEYLGPVDDEVSQALDLNGDGVVDLGDALEIAGVENVEEFRGRGVQRDGHGRIDPTPFLTAHR